MNTKEIKFLNRSKEEKKLGDYPAKAYLIINTASKCGLTPQFTGLEELNKKYKEQGLVVLGFPCDQFANQEFDDADKAHEHCQLNYGVTFEIMDKVDVNGENTAPLFKHLKSEKKGIFGTEKIMWNFGKFLVDGNGKVIKRYSPKTNPSKIEKDIVNLVK